MWLQLKANLRSGQVTVTSQSRDLGHSPANLTQSFRNTCMCDIPNDSELLCLHLQNCSLNFELPFLLEIFGQFDFFWQFVHFTLIHIQWTCTLYTQFQPHISQTDIITAPKVCGCSLSVAHGWRSIFFFDFCQTKSMFWGLFRALRVKDPKNLYYIAKKGYFWMWTHLTSVTSDGL